jgi:hypothetical protein
MHFEIQTYKATAPGAAGAAATANIGDSLIVKNGKGVIKTLASWASRQVAGFAQVITPSSHDTTRGYRAGLALDIAQLFVPLGHSLEFTAQEAIAETIAGSAVAGDIELDSHLMYYADFSGINMRSITYTQLETRTDLLTTVTSTIAAVATGEYAQEVITADSDLLKANRDYAVIGMSPTLACHATTLTSPDFGNVRVGCPGMLRPELTAQFFAAMSRIHSLPCIPVFNSGNKAQVQVGFVGNENAVANTVTLYLALLK